MTTPSTVGEQRATGTMTDGLWEMATDQGFRLQASRRTTDAGSGPILHWLFESSTGRLMSPADGCTAEQILSRLSGRGSVGSRSTAPRIPQQNKRR